MHTHQKRKAAWGPAVGGRSWGHRAGRRASTLAATRCSHASSASSGLSLRLRARSERRGWGSMTVCHTRAVGDAGGGVGGHRSVTAAVA
jgi:hypothetical protein